MHRRTIAAVGLNVTWGILRTVANIVLLLGLALVLPNFAEKARERTFSIMINLQIVVFVTIGLTIGFSRLGIRFDTLIPALHAYTGLLFDHLLQSTLIFIVGTGLLLTGQRKLMKIE